MQRIWILEDPESLFESEYYRYTGRNISVKARNPSDIGFHFGKRPDWSVLDIILWLIASVHLSGDLQHCKIFVSVFGEAQERDQVLEGLQAASGFLRGELGRRLQMRRAPEVVFQLDRGLERGTSVLGLLNRLEDERQQRGEIPPGSDQQPGSDEQPGD